MSSYIKHPFIRQVLSFHPLLIGGNPFTVTSIYVLISFLERKWGVHSAMGGTGAVVTGIGRLRGHELDEQVGDGTTGPVTSWLRDRLTDIQHGRTPDTHGWMTRLL